MAAKVKDTFKIATADGATLSAMIKTISTGMKTQRERIAVAAASCILHAVKHGQVTPCTQLVDALDGMRVNDLRQWFIAKGPVVWEETEVIGPDGKPVIDTKTGEVVMAKGFKLDKSKKAALAKEDQVTLGSDLVATPFYVWKKNPKFVPFIFEAELAKLIARTKSAAKKEDERNDFTGFDKIVLAASQLKSDKVSTDVVTLN